MAALHDDSCAPRNKNTGAGCCGIGQPNPREKEARGEGHQSLEAN